MSLFSDNLCSDLYDVSDAFDPLPTVIDIGYFTTVSWLLDDKFTSITLH